MKAVLLATKRRFSWKVWVFLLALIIPASFAVLPYSLALQPEALQVAGLPTLLLGTAVNSLVYGAVAGIGLLLAARIGLGLPFVEGWLEKHAVAVRFREVAPWAILIGIAVALAILGLSQWVFGPPMGAELEALDVPLPAEIQPAPWQGFLASFYGGIVEEALFRLFGLTLLAWLGSLVSRDPEGRPTRLVLWTANILLAVAFGLGHLPAMAAIGVPLSPLIIARSVVLNGVGGLAFGWLYWRAGLESAMVAHFSADIVLHVLAPALAVSL